MTDLFSDIINVDMIDKCILENFKGKFCLFDRINDKQNEYLKQMIVNKPINPRFQLTKEDVEIILLLYKKCIFNQSNTDKLSDIIFNSISEKYEQIYSNVNKSHKQYENIIQILDTWSASGMERILAAANMLPKVQIKKEELLEKALLVQTPSDKTLISNLQLDKLVPKNLIPKDLEQLVSKQLDKSIPKDLDKLVSKQLDKSIPKDLDKLVSKQLDKSIPIPKETPKVTTQEEKKSKESSKGVIQSSTSSNDNIYYIGGGIIVVIIIILVVLRLLKKI
jgi:hypothetical protein